MKKIQRLVALTTLLSLSLALMAQGPNNSGTYYSDANGKKGAALKTALYNIIKSPKVVSYSGLIDAYEKTDTRPDGTVRDWYSNVTKYHHGRDTGGYKKEGDSYNREHSVPQSWFSKASPMKSDIVHVVPTDGYVNNRRSSFPLAEVGNVEWSSAHGYCKLGTCKTPGYSGKVFEPNDEIKGDMARIYFYMVTCYEDRATSWGHVFSTNKAKGFDDWYLDMLMRWSKEDPVDSLEVARNEAVYQVQGNRNPYVDYPNLEDYIWGSKKDIAFCYDDYVGGQGGGTISTPVAQPVFSPAAGTYVEQVTVSLSSSTPGATIHYTTDGSDATTSSAVYEGPITLTETTTLKAIAVREEECSAQTSATFTIVPKGGNEESNELIITLNNSFFDSHTNGSVSKVNDLVGSQEGIEVIYSLGDGGKNRFCNDSQIRIYPNNTLTILAKDAQICQLVFEAAHGNDQPLSVLSGGTMSDLTWTGCSESVTFCYSGSSGHVRLSSVKVRLTTQSSGIETLSDELSDPTFWSISGQRISAPRSGLYIFRGKKVLVR